MIAIHKSENGFHPRWIGYCQEENISFRLVDCYANDLIKQLEGCTALMWHHSHGNPKDILIAQKILFTLEHMGLKVFPDFKTSWHFDDKVAQKYLLETAGFPMVNSYAFFDAKEAMKWIERTNFPKVFKLKGGAGSSNVKLIDSKKEATSVINKMFGRGISGYDAISNVNERFRKYRLGNSSLIEVLKGIIRIWHPPKWAVLNGRERGYAYFQDFIPNNESDTRIIVIGDKAFALKRYVREGDFRASGSGDFSYDKELIDEQCVKLSFEIANKLQTQCAAFDFVFDERNQPLIVEISYGFTASGYDACTGFWDEKLKWNEGVFNPQGWMVELVNEAYKV